MKILLPVAAMVVAAASCCCCGGGDIEALIEEVRKQVDGAAPAEEAVEEGEAAEAEATAEAPEEGQQAGSGAEKLCGRFKSDGLVIPSGLAVATCTTMGPYEAVLLQGTADPGAACATVKDWATGKGWSVSSEAVMGDTNSLVAGSAGKQLAVACMKQTGQTTVSLSINDG